MDNNTKITVESTSFDNAREVIQSAIENNDYLKALITIAKASKLKPKDSGLVEQLKLVRSALRKDNAQLSQKIRLLLKSEQFEEVKLIIKNEFDQKNHSFQFFNFLTTANIATGELKKARACLEVMNLINPEDTKVLFNLGNVNFELGNKPVAISWYDTCISLDENWLPPLLNLANVYRSDKNYRAAITLLRRVLNIDGASEDGLTNLAVCLLESGTDIVEVEPLLRNAIAINPKNILALNTLANHHKDLEKYRSAEVLYRQVISLDPKFAVGYNNLGTMLIEQDKISQAISMFELSLKLDENQNDVRKNLAIALKYKGKTEESGRQLWKVIKGNRFDTQAYRHLTSITHFTMDDEFTKEIQNLLLIENLTQKQLVDLNFALATICESNQKYGEAYRHYLKSNRARRLDLEYSFEKDIKCFDEARNLHIKVNAITEPPGSMDDDSVLPIFIIGMPRSGTTLVEQVISSHKKVYGCGELNHINFHYKNYIALKERLNIDDLVEFKNRYLNGVAQKFGTLECFTDKMPHNFLYVPLILKCFSKCKIIHVKRDPVATCFSSFKQYFTEGLGYSCDLENLKTYYLLYEKLMQEWELYYPDRIYSVKYEDFVTGPDIHIKELINHLDLPWDPACLSPEKNKRSVRTASQSQVKKQIYTDGIKGWENFKQFLPVDFTDFGS